MIFGNVLQTSPDAIYLARHVGLRAGVPEAVPALTVNRLCGSGFEAVIQAAMFILTGQAEVVLAGGTESMSQAPLVLRNSRWGHAFGKPPPLEDSLWSALTDSYVGLPMALTAEQLAVDHGLTQDAGGRVRHPLAAALGGRAGGRPLRRRAGAADAGGQEGAGPRSSVTSRRARRPRWRGWPGCPRSSRRTASSTPASASGIADGAAALVVASRAWAERQGLAPLARIVNWGHAGVAPGRMGLGPVPAVRNALARAGAALGDFDLFEVNEAFVAAVPGGGAGAGAASRPDQRRRRRHRARPPAGGQRRPHHRPPGPRAQAARRPGRHRLGLHRRRAGRGAAARRALRTPAAETVHRKRPVRLLAHLAPRR